MKRVVRSGEEIYRIGYGSVGEALADIKEELRRRGLMRGGLRALFRLMSGWGYLITAYPTGGWEFVDFLVHESEAPHKGLDRRLLRSAFVEGIRNRAAFVREELRKQLERLGQDPQRDPIAVLDVGCGVGTFTFHTLSCTPNLKSTIKAVGIDRDPRAITLAKRLAHNLRLNPRIEFLCTDAFTYLKETAELFDLVIFIGILAYLPDHRAVRLLQALRARMREGGVLLTSHLHPKVSRIMLAWLRLMGLESLRPRTPAQLEALLRRANFEPQITRDASDTQNLIVAEASPMRFLLDGVGELTWVEIHSLRDHEEVEPEQVEQLTREILKTRRIEPILVERKHWVILDGHHRKAALERLGIGRIPCFIVPYEHVGLTSWRGIPLTKAEVIARALTGRKFPPKTTCHLYTASLPEVELPLPDPSPQDLHRSSIPRPHRRIIMGQLASIRKRED